MVCFRVISLVARTIIIPVGKVVADHFRGVARDHRNPFLKRVKFPAVRQDLRADLGLAATGEVAAVVCVDDDQPEVRPP